MRSIKVFIILLMFCPFPMLILTSTAVKAQDAIVISEGNFVRGTIQGTDFSTVILKNEEETLTQYKAKDIKEFLWNGETYVSKPIVIKKKMEHRFFRLLEQGAVNLYSIGGQTSGLEEVQPKKARIRPNIGIGGGTGGFGGLGGGVGITIGGGRNRQGEQQSRVLGPTAYFIEKFGTGPMLEIPEVGNSGGKTQHVKNILLLKLTNDEDLAERIKATESFDPKLVRSFVAAYNAMHK